VYRIWEDSDIGVTLTRSVTTIKADAARRSFTRGEGICGPCSIQALMARTALCLSLPMHGSIDSFAVRRRWAS
jgi:hypothetical protein